MFDVVEARDGGAYLTDNGNLVADCLGWRGDAHALAAALQAIPGVVGHGLFLTEVDAAYIATDGIVATLERAARRNPLRRPAFGVVTERGIA